jgi:hypothetical protein
MTDTTDRPSLEDRIARLEAIEAIKVLKHRYLRACDAKEPDVFRDCFVAKGAFVDYGPRVGRFDDADGIAEVFRNVALREVGGAYTIFDMHHAMHPEIVVESETTARGQWSLRFRQVDTVERVERLSAIEYDDAYEVEGGQWRIRSCQVRVLWSMIRPLGDEVQIVDGFHQ